MLTRTRSLVDDTTNLVLYFYLLHRENKIRSLNYRNDLAINDFVTFSSIKIYRVLILGLCDLIVFFLWILKKKKKKKENSVVCFFCVYTPVLSSHTVVFSFFFFFFFWHYWRMIKSTCYLHFKIIMYIYLWRLFFIFTTYFASYSSIILKVSTYVDNVPYCNIVFSKIVKETLNFWKYLS